MSAVSRAGVNRLNVDRRVQLIESTIEVIYRDGLSRLTLAKVARQAGLSTSIVNFYFKTKEQLLLETLQTVSQEYEAAVGKVFESSPDPVETLKALVDAMLDPELCTPARAAVWYAFMGESQARADYSWAVRVRELAIRQRIEGLFTALFSEAGASASQGSHAVPLARAFDALIDSIWEQSVMEPDTLDLDHARKICLDYLASVLPEGLDTSTGTPSGKPTSISNDISEGMLSAWTYTSAELYDLEMAELFRREWILAGHIADVPAPGDYLTLELGPERVLVVRDEKHQLHAFHNVCRHRGSRVVPKSQGNCGHVMRCPFHGWTYRLDGRLKSVPRLSTFEGLDIYQQGLIPLELEVWQGLVFIRFEAGGEPVAKQLEAIAEQVGNYRLADMTSLGEASVSEVSYNWKFFHDVDNEGYHVPSAHPALQELYGRTYRDDLIGEISVSTGVVDDHPANSWSVARYKSLLPDAEHLPSESRRLWLYFSIFPNAILYFYPEKAGYYMSLPRGPNVTQVVSREYGLSDASRKTRAAQYLSRRIDTLTSHEDNALVQWLQEAAGTSVFPLDNLADIEAGVLQFHRRLKQKIPVMGKTSPPASGALADANRKLQARLCA